MLGSGGDDLPSLYGRGRHAKVPAFFRHAGVKLNSIALEFTRSGPAAATINRAVGGRKAAGAAPAKRPLPAGS
jgi:hypothetical protein